MYLWGLQSFGRLGWLAAFLFMACGALRLARFNTQVGTISSEHFVGLPIPAGAGMVATTILFFKKVGLVGGEHPVILLLMLYALSFLMVSAVKYNSFKRAELFRSMNFNVLVAAVLLLIFIASQPSIAFFLMGLIYIFSGPVTFVLHHYRPKTTEAVDTAQLDENNSGTI